jgi:hypothetical protein
VNVEQASKRVMWEPSRLNYGEGRCRMEEALVGHERQTHPVPPG